MRFDHDGLFWKDEPKLSQGALRKLAGGSLAKSRPSEKRQPPDPVWLDADYLPNYDEAISAEYPQLTDDEIISACNTQAAFFLDIECYINYFLVSFQAVSDGKFILFELRDGGNFQISKLKWVLSRITVIGFNTNRYDLPLIQKAIGGASTRELKHLSDEIILEDKTFRSKAVTPVASIDLIEIAPGQVSLKTYAGRLHASKMMDLPFHPQTELSDKQITILKYYCCHIDLANTKLLYESLLEQISLRNMMSEMEGIDVRSSSDAQIAETVIKKRLGLTQTSSLNLEGKVYRFIPPSCIKFKSDYMKGILKQITSMDFKVKANGHIHLPDELSDMIVTINEGSYQMGIGGLHSCEKSVSYFATPDCDIVDRDVTSYYPSIILTQHLAPRHLGGRFLQVYKNIVDKRLLAKQTGDKITADSLKIVINSVFGKFGSPHSAMYSPDLGLQITVSGQLMLLMLIEALDEIDIKVISANTDGVVFLMPHSKKEEVAAVIKAWEENTGMETEETKYKSIHSKDVNNYIALKEKGGFKAKGLYAPESLAKNPQGQVCVDAVVAFLESGTSIEEHIRSEQRISKFAHIRGVKGGAVKNGKYLGKTIRWVYMKGESGEIIYATNGNKVPKSDNATPMMTLINDTSQIDFDKYIADAKELLVDIGLDQSK